jgi:hypothetical protein
MEEKTKKAIQMLRIQFYLFWIIPILLVVLYETAILPVGIYADDPQTQFILENIGILIAIIAVPLSLKYFNKILKKSIDNVSFPIALDKYQLWSGVRLGVLDVVVVFNLIVYYSTLNNIGGLCALIALTASFFCFPNEKRLRQELYIENDDEA